MSILLNNHGYGNNSWQSELLRQLPTEKVHNFGEEFDPNDITYALIWNHPPGDLNRYPNLRAIFLLGAGTEHLAADPLLPDVPVVILADPAVARDMAGHAIYWVLDRHRQYHTYRAQQNARRWERRAIVPTEHFKVGVLGLGRIGATVAQRIHHCGYAVTGWDAVPTRLAGIDARYGPAQFCDFLSEPNVIINCLPLTDKTRHMLDAGAFAAMGPGAFFVNISRGAVVDDGALLDALNSGHLSGAALDAFSVEPLPDDSPFWIHPQVHITPHMAGATFAGSAVSVIVENISKLNRGEVVQPLFDRHKAG
jgi:glyoxylate/hydroxypyruvate reductase A